jgi:hypothetical protein
LPARSASKGCTSHCRRCGLEFIPKASGACPCRPHQVGTSYSTGGPQCLRVRGVPRGCVRVAHGSPSVTLIELLQKDLLRRARSVKTPPGSSSDPPLLTYQSRHPLTRPTLVLRAKVGEDHFSCAMQNGSAIFGFNSRRVRFSLVTNLLRKIGPFASRIHPTSPERERRVFPI